MATATPLSGSTRSPRHRIESGERRAALASGDAGSATSHASSSRLPASGPSSSSSHQPIALADALDRANGDYMAALDEILAERNRYCLEAGKLASENVRIWNLMGRIRKDNETLKAIVVELERGTLGGPAPSRGSPLAAAPAILGSFAAPPLPKRRVAAANEGGILDTRSPMRGFSEPRPNSNAPSPTSLGPGPRSPMLSPDPPRSPLSQGHSPDVNGASSASASPTPFQNVQLHPDNGDADLAQRAAAGELATPPTVHSSSFAQHSTPQRSNAHSAFLPPLQPQSPFNIASTSHQPSPAAISIIQQRAAAQAQSLALQSQGDAAAGYVDESPSRQSQDFEAVDGSSIASDEPVEDGAAHASRAEESTPIALRSRPDPAQFLARPDVGSAINEQPASPVTRHIVPEMEQHSSPRRLRQRSPPHLQLHSPPDSPASRHAQLSSGQSAVTTPTSAHPSPRRRDTLTSAVSAAFAPATGRFASPRLDSTLLRTVNLRVAGSNLRTNERGKEVISFFVTVEILSPPPNWGAGMLPGESFPPTVWRIEKMYSDVLALDARLKQKHGRSATKRIAQLPDKTLFKDHAPSKVDQRKIILEVYLQNLLSIQLPDKDDLCTFLCTDVLPVEVKDPTSTTKDGFLTKKGQNLGRWVTRFYSLRDARLDYFEFRGGAHLGSINIIGAQIGRQQRSATSDMDENSYRHAFLILEKRPGGPGEPPQMVRHVLCSESDSERDDWVDVLVRAIARLEKDGKSGGAGSPRASSSAMSTSEKAPSQTDSRPAQPKMKRSGSLSRRLRKEAAPSISSTVNGEDEADESGLGAMGPPSHSATAARRLMEKESSGQSQGAPPYQMPTSTSTPVSMESAPREHGTARSNSDLGRYSGDTAGHSHPMAPSASAPSGARSGPNAAIPASEQRFAPTRSSSQDLTASSSAADVLQAQRPVTPEMRGDGATPTRGSKPSISGPMNGTPIPTGYKFGAKDEPAAVQDPKKDDRKRFWQGFRGFGGHDKHGQRHEARPVFGIPLAESIAVSSVAEGLELPSVVYRCIEYLEKRNAAQEEGIYRLSGSTAVIKALKDRFNVEGDVDLLTTEQYYDPHAIAGLLKTFLRELPTSVLTRELHLEFMRVNDIIDRKERVNELGMLVSQLPLANYSLLRTLCSHLIKIIDAADVNKMTMRNVGIVFSPTLAIPAGVFSLFLTEYDFIFYVDAGGEPAPRQIEEDILVPDPSDMGLDDATSEESAMTAKTSTDGLGLAQTGGLAAPNGRNGARHANRISWIAGGSIGMGSSGQVLQLRSKRNSLQYAESEADKLLGLGGRRLSNHIIELDPDGAMAEEGDFGGDFVSEGRASVDDDRAASSSTDHSARVYVDASAMESSDPAIVPDSSSARSSGQKQLASANASANPNTNSNANLRSLGVTVPNGHLQTHPPLSPAGSTRSSRSARRSIIPPASSISNMNSTSSGSSSSSAAQAKVQQPIPSGTAHPRSPPPHMA